MFLSAALLFVVQPMFARMVLPLLGSSPAVWNTTMVFYQAVLLAGYGYVHLTTRLGPRRQALLHAVLLLLPLAVLPLAVPRGWTPPTASNPVPWLLALLAVSVGLPFFVVSTTGPLLQKWFAAAGHGESHDPYFLYAASNLGSMAGLLSYPFAIEGWLRLGLQSRVWAIGYGALVVLTLGCAWAVRRAGRAAGAPSHATATGAPPAFADTRPVTAGRRLRWVALALVPSSLMLAVTTHISTDIAAIPLLWVLPLSLYLATFVLVFARRVILPPPLVLRAMPLTLLPLAVLLVSREFHPAWLIIPLHLFAQFVVTMVCHGELARDRPDPRHLTGFYLWIAVGGVLGGAFTALVAPLAFTQVVEYPLMLVLACVLAPPIRPPWPGVRAAVLDVALPVLLGLVVAAAIGAATSSGLTLRRMDVVLIASLLAFPLFSFSRRPLRFGLGLAALFLVNPVSLEERGRTLHAERSFFGVHRVTVDRDLPLHRLVHGSTVHGLQSTDPALRREPLGYYGRESPIGQVIAARIAGRPARVAVVGLGAGTLAAYGEPGQEWTFYEIDPVVERIARDPRYFTYLRDCPARVRVVLGDARLSLAAAADERYDLIVLDAYSSDAIPIHLITREALRLYADRLAPDGVLAFHISNRHFDLERVLAALAADAGWTCATRDDPANTVDLPKGVTPSRYTVMSRRPGDLAVLRGDASWAVDTPEPGFSVWTDDLVSPARVFRWRG